MRSRRVAARATRTALIVASVPELTKRTRSIAGISDLTRSPRRTSSSEQAPKLVPLRTARVSAATSPAGACPWMSGPHDIMQSM